MVDFLFDPKGNSRVEYQPPGLLAPTASSPLRFSPNPKEGQVRVEVEWEVATNPLLLRPGSPRIVVHLRAVRDCQIVTWLLKYQNLRQGGLVWAAPFFVSDGSGKRRLRVRRLGGPARVVGLEDLETEIDPTPCGVEAYPSIDQIRNVTEWREEAEFHHWSFLRSGWGSERNPSRLLLQKGQCFALVACANVAVKCLGKIAGV